MDIKTKATYSLEKEKTSSVLEECSECLAVAYHNNAGERDVITKVVAETITDKDVTFYFLDDSDTVTIPVDKIIDWIC